MPPAVAAFAAWAGISVAAAYVVVASVVISAGTAIYGAAQARKAERAARNTTSEAMKDRMVTRIATEAPHRYIYGRAKVGADVVAMFTSGERDQFKHLVCVHAAHECDAIEGVYINNKLVGTLDDNGFATEGYFTNPPDVHTEEQKLTGPNIAIMYRPIVGTVKVFSGSGANMVPVTITASNDTTAVYTVAYTGPVTVVYDRPKWGELDNTYKYGSAENEFSSSVRVQRHLGGASDTVDTYLQSVVGAAKWPSTSVLRGMCYTVITLDLNHAEFQGGLVPIHALIRGKKLYDPRDGQTRWSQNPALAIMDYLTSPLCGVPMADLPAAQFIAAANVCDEASPTGGARYTLNGTVTSDQGQAAVLESMTQAMAGGMVATTWDVYAGKYIAPVAALTQADIVGSLSVTPGVSDASVYNGVKGQYIGPENNHVQTDFKPYQNAVYRESDGRDLYTNIDFPFTESLQRVTNLARIFTEDQRNGFTIKAEFSLKAWPLKVGQRITFTGAFLGQTAKVYRITDKSYAPNSSVQLSLKEDDASIWDYADAIVVDSTPNSDLPNPWKIDPLASISCTSGEAALLRQADGSTVPRILVTWPAQTQPNAVQIDVEWRAVSSPTWERTTVSASETQAYLSPITPGFFYLVRARVTNPSLGLISRQVATVYQVEVFTATPTVYMYAADQPAPPAGVGNYQWSNGTFGAAPAGWSLTEPTAPAGGNVTLWAATVGISDISDVLSSFNWADAEVRNIGYAPATAGTGPAGYSNARVFAYQRKATAPTGTPGAVNYDFTTGKISTATLANGWLKDIPPADGNPLHVTSASASAAGTTDAIASSEWSGAVILAENGAQGPQGAQGNQGVQGPKGADGLPTYTWIKYSDNADGTNLYDTPSDSTLYIGIATNRTVQAESTVKTDYVWSRFRGGQGVQGPIGPNGQPTYTWIKYADNAAGAGITDNPAGKLYIGFAYNKSTDVESAAPGDYLWSLIKGDQGAAGLNSATVTLYQRTPSATAPAKPSGAATYTFATGAITGLNNGWLTYIPTTGGAYLHTTFATAIAATATDTIAATEWATVQLMYDAADLIAAKSAADAANLAVTDMARDDLLSPAEKPAENLRWISIVSERPGIDSAAAALGVTTERTAYASAYNTLSAYIGGLGAGFATIPGSAISIVGATYRANFKNYFDAKQALLNAIAAKSATVAQWSGIGGAGKPVDNASADLVLYTFGTGVIVVTGNSVVKTSTTAAWDSSVHSGEGYTGGAYASARTVGAYDLMFGLNADSNADASYTSLDYAVRTTTTGGIEVYESGNYMGSYPNYAVGDVLTVVYDGSAVRYGKNGVVFRTTPLVTPIGSPLCFDSSFYTPGSALLNIRFGPLTSNNWALVGGTGKPQDNATVGAPAGTQVAGVDAATVAAGASAGNKLNTAFTVSIGNDVNTTFTNGGVRTITTKTATITGGEAPFEYLWVEPTGAGFQLVNATTGAVTLKAGGYDETRQGELTISVKDKQGRVAYDKALLNVTFSG